MNKDILLIITPELGSGGGCIFYRINLLANYINANPSFNTKVIVSCMPLFDADLLMRTKAVLVQRPMSTMPFIRTYKIVGEVDDLWTTWHGMALPDYHPNFIQKRDYDVIDKVTAENLSYMDAMIVSTDELKRVLNVKYNFWNVYVLPNAAPRCLFNSARKDFFREKPVCIIPSGKQHYSDPVQISPQFPAGKVGMRGDYTGKWADWINDKVSKDEIDLTEMAGTAYFFDRKLISSTVTARRSRLPSGSTGITTSVSLTVRNRISCSHRWPITRSRGASRTSSSSSAAPWVLYLWARISRSRLTRLFTLTAACRITRPTSRWKRFSRT